MSTDAPDESAYRWFSVVNGRLGDVVLKAPTRREACDQAERLGVEAYVYGEYASGGFHWFQVWERVEQWGHEWAEVQGGFNLPFKPARPFESFEN